uniref:Spindle assembly abnormal protein 5, SAS-5 n=1 Tax=Ancylostoma ceylanicum TaxID=53326 RepID=Q6KC48_9BILA|nr:spindle assembly abnormal protein 5, SAS-5 [Ancylostoma ceylanicum]
MNGGTDGPLCSLISYVVPPGLSRVPTVGPAEVRPHTSAPIETVSAKNKQEVAAAPLTETSPVPRHTTRPARLASNLPAIRAAPAGTNPSAPLVDETVHNRNQTSPSLSPVKAPSRPPKKSCLTKNTTSNVVPARLNLKKKTVAFGKTVNVSQTIEGTSHSSKLKRQMNKTAVSQPTLNDADNKENSLRDVVEQGEQGSLFDILKDVKSSLEALRARDEERAEELRSIRRLVDEKGKEMDNLRGILADFFSKDCPRSAELSYSLSTKKPENAKSPPRRVEKDKRNRSPNSPIRRYSPLPRDGKNLAHRDPGPNNVDDITYEEFRRLITTNPALRQFVSDLLAEEKEQRTGYAYRHKRSEGGDSPWRNVEGEKPTREPRLREDSRTRGPRGAKFTEKVTVERSVRCSPPELGQYSVDTRRYIADQILEDEDEVSQSMYRPGESVSYYPENVRTRGYGGDPMGSDDDQGPARCNYRDYATIGERRRQRRDRRTDRYQDY